MVDHANKYFLQRSLMMKLQFPTRKRGQTTPFKRVSAHVSNFIYHLKKGKTVIQAWDLAKRTF